MKLTCKSIRRTGWQLGRSERLAVSDYVHVRCIGKIFGLLMLTFVFKGIANRYDNKQYNTNCVNITTS